MHLFRAKRKFCVDMPDTSSKCTALVTAHVNSAIYALFVSPFDLTNSDPVKSIPITSNGGAQ